MPVEGRIYDCAAADFSVPTDFADGGIQVH